MNKRQFLDILAYNLGNLNSDIRDDILCDFSEHFDFAAQEGRSEEETCQTLGDPTDIAAQFIAEYRQALGIAPDSPEPPPIPQMPNAPQKPRDISTVDWKHENAALEDIRVFDGGLNEIHITLKNTNIKLIESNGDMIEVNFHNNKNKSRYITTVENAALIINETSSHFNIFNLVDFGQSMTVSIPKRFCGNILAKVGSGNIRGENIKINHLSTRTGSGNVQIYSCVGRENMICQTGSGNITADKCEFPELKASTGSGNVKISDNKGAVSGSTGSGNIIVSGNKGTVSGGTGSGNIKIETDEITENSRYATGSGNISLRAQKLLSDISLATGSGNITLSVNEVCASIHAKTSASWINAEFGRESSLRFDIRHNKFGGKVTNEFDGTANGIHTVKLETAVGSINVKAM